MDVVVGEDVADTRVAVVVEDCKRAVEAIGRDEQQESIRHNSNGLKIPSQSLILLMMLEEVVVVRIGLDVNVIGLLRILRLPILLPMETRADGITKGPPPSQDQVVIAQEIVGGILTAIPRVELQWKLIVVEEPTIGLEDKTENGATTRIKLASQAATGKIAIGAGRLVPVALRKQEESIQEQHP